MLFGFMSYSFMHLLEGQGTVAWTLQTLHRLLLRGLFHDADLETY